MGLTRAAIEAMAPDQAALKAAAGLVKPAKWPVRARAGGLVWGECQGSGANPYRVAADTEDPGSKCTCPSRKFPCKHGIALMWMFVEDAASFPESAVPDWVSDWMGRRRKTAAVPPANVIASNPKSMDAALAVAETAPADPEADAKRVAAAEKRAANTARLVSHALDELETWITDQLRTGLPAFLAEAGDRCRRIAARLVDGKAGALASRLDELPARLLAVPNEERVDVAIAELGKIFLLARAWRAAPTDPELRREVVASETREAVLDGTDCHRIASVWEVLGEEVETRRDGLVSVATWLLEIGGHSGDFALLLDFFPASAGRRAGAFAPGERFFAEIVFYPSRAPLRAVIAARDGRDVGETTWPAAPADPLAPWVETLLAVPWRSQAPLLLPPGRIAADGRGHAWWCSVGGAASLPLAGRIPPLLFGAEIEAAAGVWSGARLALLCGRTNWGRVDVHG